MVAQALKGSFAPGFQLHLNVAAVRGASDVQLQL